MTYQVLARKWRPQDFSSIIGQEHVVTALRNAVSVAGLMLTTETLVTELEDDAEPVPEAIF